MPNHQREALAKAVQKVRRRVAQVRERGERIGEENTKAALIDPFLAALGWDSPSFAVGMAQNKVIGPPADGRQSQPTNGWSFWQFIDSQTGKLKSVEALRQKYLATQKGKPELKAVESKGVGDRGFAGNWYCARRFPDFVISG